MVREKTFIGSDVKGKGVFPAECGQQWQFRLYLYPLMESPSVHSPWEEVLSDKLQLRP